MCGRRRAAKAVLGDVEVGLAVVAVDAGEQIVEPFGVDLPGNIRHRRAPGHARLELQRLGLAAVHDVAEIVVDA